MTFDACFTRLLGHEGGYSNHPDDPGGATNWGITEAVARANGYSGDMRKLTQTQARQIYRKLYWDPPGIINLPPELHFDVFDGAVNSGPTQAVKWLQRAIGVVDDGVIGQKTLHACSLIPPAIILARYNGHRLHFMTNLKTWPTFGKGWARRIAVNLIGA